MLKKKFIKYPRYLFRKQLSLGLIKKYVPKGAHFLDVGCGAGDFAFSLVEKGYSGHLIDFSEEAGRMVESRIKKEKSHKITFSQKDLFEFDSEEIFELITFFEVLEHTKNDKAFLAKAYRLLKPGGYIILSVPARKKYWGIHDRLAGHLRRYEKTELAYLLEKNNFQILKLYSYGFPFLNLLKIVRNVLAKQKMKKLEGKSRLGLTKKSGLNLIKIPFITFISNKYMLYPFIQFSRLFNTLDLSEGYLCLAQKNK